MATLAAMKSRITREIARTDLTVSVADAINDAIAEYERERFWFNESRDLTFSTVADERVYTTADATWIPNVIEIDAMFVTVSGQNRTVRKADPSELELLSDNTAGGGVPYLWAYLDGGIQLYPIPDAVYTVRAVAHYRLDELDDADSNAWTTEAEQLIRRTAKAILAADTTLDFETALASEPFIQRSLASLRAETSRRKTVGRITPTTF